MMKKIFLIVVCALLVTAAFSAQAAITSYLFFGLRGPQVTELQNRLTQLGFYNGPVTGYFGPLTREAVIKFQAARNIPQLGVVGPLTRAALNASAPPAPSPTASISSLSPSSGPVGTKVTITGTGFTLTGNKIRFGNSGSENNPKYSLPSPDGKTITFTVPSSNYLACWDAVPACMAPAVATAPGIYGVSVINANGTSNSMTFTVTAPVSDSSLKISSLSPSSGPIGTTVTVYGSGFSYGGSGFTANSRINFDVGSIAPTFVNSTTLRFVVPEYLSPYCPPGAACALYVKEVKPGNYTVSVSNESATSNTVTFTVTSY